MGSKIEVVKATKARVDQLLAKPIRQEDVDEWVLASGGQRVERILKERVIVEDSRACLADGDCIALWGMVAAADSNTGIIWFIANEEAEALADRIARRWAKEEALFFERVDYLYAYVWDGNELHQKWLKRMGFEACGVVDVAQAPGISFTVFRKDKPACADQSSPA